MSSRVVPVAIADAAAPAEQTATAEVDHDTMEEGHIDETKNSVHSTDSPTPDTQTATQNVPDETDVDDGQQGSNASRQAIQTNQESQQLKEQEEFSQEKQVNSGAGSSEGVMNNPDSVGGTQADSEAQDSKPVHGSSHTEPDVLTAQEQEGQQSVDSSQEYASGAAHDASDGGDHDGNDAVGIDAGVDDGVSEAEGGDSDEDDESSSSDEDDSGSEYEVPVRTHGDWDAFVDEESGTEYYYNRQTGETTWDVPDPALMPPHIAALEFLNKLMTNPYDLEQPHPLSSHGDWSLYVDSESMAMYYCNDDTGETSWEPPAEWDEKFASIPPLAVLTGEDDSEPGGLAALLAAKSGGQPSKPDSAPATTAREPTGPDSERAEATDKGSGSATSVDEGAKKVDLEKGLESIDQEKVWFVYRDMESLTQYFVNAKTGESCWEPPLDIAAQVIEHEAANVQPGEWQLYINKADEEEEEDDCVAKVKGWEVYQDRASGRWYYFNPKTGETQWDAPDDVLQAAPEDWEAGGANTDADGNVINHGEDEEPEEDAQYDEVGAESEGGQEEPEEEASGDEAQADAEDEGGQTGSEKGGEDLPASSEAATAVDAVGVADEALPAHDVAQALQLHQDSLQDEERAATTMQPVESEEGQSANTPSVDVDAETSAVSTGAGQADAQAAPATPERAVAPKHVATSARKSRPPSRPQSRPPTRPPTAGKKKKSKKDKSEKKKDKSKKKKDKSKKKKDKSKKKKKSSHQEEESDSDSDLGDLLGANAISQHQRPLAAGAAIQQTIDVSQRHRAASNAGGATSVMDAIAMIQRAYGMNAESDDEGAADQEEASEGQEHTPAPPKQPVKKADEDATYKIFMPPPPKPTGNVGLGFGLAMGVKSRFGKKPLAPGMDVEDPEEEERKRREAEQESIRARILAAQEAKRKQEEEDAKLAELEGNDDASANALNLLASAAGLSATELAKMLERRKVDDPNNKGLLAWAKAFLQKTQKKAKTLESRLRLDSKIDEETKQKLQDEIKRLKLLCEKLREWEDEERKRRREMDEEMKKQLQAQAEAEKERLQNKRARIRAEREAAKKRAADERKRKAEEARAAMMKRKEQDAAMKAQLEADKAAELERKRALAAGVKS